MSLLLAVLCFCGRIEYKNVSLDVNVSSIETPIVYLSLEIENVSSRLKLRLPGFRIGMTQEDNMLVSDTWRYTIMKDGEVVYELRPFIKMIPPKDILLRPQEKKAYIFSIDLSSIIDGWNQIDGWTTQDDITGNYSLQVCCSVSNKYTIISNAIEFSIP